VAIITKLNFNFNKLEKNMKNIYYLLWGDAIINSKSYKSKDPFWKSNLLWLITTFNGFNFLLIKMWLEYLNLYHFNFFFNFAGNSFILGLLEAFLNFFLPVGFINYLTIFYKDRYKKMIVKYPHYNGKLVLSYIFASVILLFGTIIFIRLYP